MWKIKNRSKNPLDAAGFTNFLCLVSEMHLMTKLKPQDKRPDMEQLIYILLYSLLKWGLELEYILGPGDLEPVKALILGF